MSDPPIYLDYNATTPLCRESAQAMKSLLDNTLEDPTSPSSLWGNPSSGHVYGTMAKERLESAREEVATAINASSPSSVVFTSGGTESLNHAIKGVCLAAFERSRKQTVASTVNFQNNIITSNIEHPAVSKTIDYLVNSFGFSKTVIKVDKHGCVAVDDVIDAVDGKTVLITIMLANNEIGTLQPISEICSRLKETEYGEKVLVHTDASQAVGKIKVDVEDLGVDMLSLAGHKFYGPKGVGALYLRRPEIAPNLHKLMHGANHERDFRAGTENVLLAAGLGAAARAFHQGIDEEIELLSGLRDQFQDLLVKKCETKHIEVRVNGHMEKRLPNTLSIGFKGISSINILSRISGSVSCSVGAACHTGDTLTTSHVLRACSIPHEYAAGTLRLSVGRYTKLEDIVSASNTIVGAILQIREDANRRKIIQDRGLSDLPPTKLLYFEDTYNLHDVGCVIKVSPSGLQYPAAKEAKELQKDNHTRYEVILDQTIFHPQGGGQPSDTGEMYCKVLDSKFVVEHVEMSVAKVVHHHGYFLPAQKVPVGTEVELHVDQKRREVNARLHSAGHLLDQAMLLCGVDMLATKGCHFPGACSVEYKGTVPSEERPSLKTALEETVNGLVQQNIPTRVLNLSTNECTKYCMDGQAPVGDVDQVFRVVIVGGSMGCPCGGTHVSSSKEIGYIKVKKLSCKKGMLKVSYEVMDSDN